MFDTCYYHPDRRAVAKCNDCYKSLCQDDIRKVEGMSKGMYVNKIVCPDCAKNYPGLVTTPRGEQVPLVRTRKPLGLTSIILLIVLFTLSPLLLLVLVFPTSSFDVFRVFNFGSNNGFKVTALYFSLFGNLLFFLFIFLIFRVIRRKVAQSMVQQQDYPPPR